MYTVHFQTPKHIGIVQLMYTEYFLKPKHRTCAVYVHNICNCLLSLLLFKSLQSLELKVLQSSDFFLIPVCISGKKRHA